MQTQPQLWMAMGARLGVQVLTPFSINLRSGQALFTGLLPHFGGPSGIVVDPNWSVIKPFAGLLQKAGYGYSCVGLDESFDDAVEMLNDLGVERGRSEAKLAFAVGMPAENRRWLFKPRDQRRKDCLRSALPVANQQ